MLEAKSGLARRFGQRLNSPMIPEPAAIKDYLLNTGSFGALGDQLTNCFGAIDFGLASNRFGQRRVFRRSGDQRPAGGIINHLGIYMNIATKDAESRPLKAATDALSHPQVPPNS
jgi:hypothetical protein